MNGDSLNPLLPGGGREGSLEHSPTHELCQLLPEIINDEMVGSISFMQGPLTASTS